MTELHGWYIKRHYGGGGKSAPSAPPPPDFRGAALEQAAASKELTTQQTWANRPTINTPWGQQTWQAGSGVDPSTGQAITNWTTNVNLTPEGQSALNAQQRIQEGRSEGAETLLGQSVGNFQSPFNWGGLPRAPGNAPGAEDISGRQQGAFQKLSAMVQPGRMQEQESLEVQLANMGLPRNSEAWNRAKSQLSNQWASQDERLLAQAMAEGRTDATSQFGMNQQSADQQQRFRQQAIAEEAQRRGMTLNELNALLTGQQVSMPQMPNFQPAQAAQAPNLLGAASSLGQYNLGNAQLAAQSGGSDWGSGIAGIASLAGAAAPYFGFSDARLKTDVKRIGTHDSLGIGVYTYVLNGVRQIGVLAQELMAVRPDLVVKHPSGFLMVNYGGL